MLCIEHDCAFDFSICVWWIEMTILSTKGLDIFMNLDVYLCFVQSFHASFGYFVCLCIKYDHLISSLLTPCKIWSLIDLLLVFLHAILRTSVA